MLGGGYGRRIWPDAAIQATILSNITKKPVKLILTREDDLAAARPRPMTHHVLIGVIAVAPAIANGLFQLTGRRVRTLPMSPNRVKKALT
jgi:CO/xanthine dehydrogenase Mo-binding subunit